MTNIFSMKYYRQRKIIHNTLVVPHLETIKRIIDIPRYEVATHNHTSNFSGDRNENMCASSSTPLR